MKKTTGTFLVTFILALLMVVPADAWNWTTVTAYRSNYQGGNACWVVDVINVQYSSAARSQKNQTPKLLVKDRWGNTQYKAINDSIYYIPELDKIRYYECGSEVSRYNEVVKAPRVIVIKGHKARFKGGPDSNGY